MEGHEVLKPFLASQFSKRKQWAIGIAWDRIKKIDVNDYYIVNVNNKSYKQKVSVLINIARDFPPPEQLQHREIPFLTSKEVLIVPLNMFECISDEHLPQQMDLDLEKNNEQDK
ncbi:hypothetical protein ACFL3D_01975 [Candidatus Omnitrophota bacterium]